MNVVGVRYPLSHDFPRFSLLTGCAGFLLTLLTFFPGYLTTDSLNQYEQALAFRFYDWHPPIMAVLWSILNSVWTGPEPMLLLQAGFFWTGAYVLLSVLPTRSLATKICIIALLFSPAILNFIGVIWKDVQLASMWSFAAIIVYARLARGLAVSVSLKAMLLTMVAYGALVRYNAILVAGPLVLYIVCGRPFLGKIWKTLLVYSVIALVLVGLEKAVNAASRAQPTPIVNGLLSFDLAGITARTGENHYPFNLTNTEREKVNQCYGRGATHDTLIWGDCKFIWQRISELPGAGVRGLQTAWLSSVANDPVAYIAHRVGYFTTLLFSNEASKYIWQNGSTENEFNIRTRTHGLYHIVRWYVVAFSTTLIFRPGTWLLLSLLLLLLSRCSGISSATKNFISTLGVVGTLYLLTYLPFGVAADFRYAYLSIVAASFASCAVTAEYLARKVSSERKIGFPRAQNEEVSSKGVSNAYN